MAKSPLREIIRWVSICPVVRLLLSGFGPFSDVQENPSALLVQDLASQPLGSFSLRGVLLPVVFGRAAAELLEAVVEFTPDVVVAFGLGRTERAVCVERFAVNLADSTEPDNQGRSPREEPIEASGPAGYLSTLPVAQLADSLRRAGVDARASTGAGTYVCNDLFYRLMHGVASMSPVPRAGFVHLPRLAGAPRADPLAPRLDRLASAFREALVEVFR